VVRAEDCDVVLDGVTDEDQDTLDDLLTLAVGVNVEERDILEELLGLGVGVPVEVTEMLEDLLTVGVGVIDEVSETLADLLALAVLVLVCESLIVTVALEDNVSAGKPTDEKLGKDTKRCKSTPLTHRMVGRRQTVCR
jgi:hypothetical protein